MDTHDADHFGEIHQNSLWLHPVYLRTIGVSHFVDCSLQCSNLQLS
jgi:hypothetical protein